MSDATASENSSSEELTGTLISHPSGGQLYFSPYHYRDGSAALRERPDDFAPVADELLARLTAQLDAEGSSLPTSAGEYVELGERF